MISFHNVCKHFPLSEQLAVNDVSLTIPSGKTIVFLGSSGSGKTTCLKMINRLENLTSGSIEIDGENNLNLDLITLRRQCGYAFQQVGLFAHLTVAENISLVLKLEKVSAAEQKKRAHELLEFVNLAPYIYADRFPDELSGGQQQRVGVARALANKPKYLLMDEPFGALDAITRDNLQKDFLSVKEQLDITVIFVTHDVFEALRIGDMIAVMHQGQLVQCADKQTIVNNPANDFVKDLFQKPVNQLSHWLEHFRMEDK